MPAASAAPGAAHCCTDVLGRPPARQSPSLPPQEAAWAPFPLLCWAAPGDWAHPRLRAGEARVRRKGQEPSEPPAPSSADMSPHGAFLLLASDGSLRLCVPQSPHSHCLLGLCSQGSPRDAVVAGSPGRSKCWVLAGSRQLWWAGGYLAGPGRPRLWAPGVALHALEQLPGAATCPCHPGLALRACAGHLILPLCLEMVFHSCRGQVLTKLCRWALKCNQHKPSPLAVGCGKLRKWDCTTAPLGLLFPASRPCLPLPVSHIPSFALVSCSSVGP